ncbi:uncharacterized protein BJ171DRAFT_216174 [Polychytrium aggregatum]|uniref:uncharacterized protein n=1 Tax=Polychytrium aggregatum TaxID=110093 RepID=UPI0022FE8D46|nr:uncharacterized protein BJ171DRAFT_216174 [Polychytrium aggregatum]KAI9199322.1 hypothetical protein BJ171DRAFT_216174 [Polychytrium aggregatum]
MEERFAVSSESQPAPPQTRSLKEMYKEAFRLANMAVAADQAGDMGLATTLYKETVELLIEIYEGEKPEDKKQKALSRANEYVSRLETLKSMGKWTKSRPSATPLEHICQQAQFAYEQATELDQSESFDEAEQSYLVAIQIYQKAIEMGPDSPVLSDLVKRLENLQKRAAELALNRVVVDRLGSLMVSTTLPVSRHAPPGSEGPTRLSEAELEVIKGSSVVNGRIYPPWLETDKKERFAFSRAFEDPDGLLAMSDQQIDKAAVWKRPAEFMSKPTIFSFISGTTLIQDTITDCSFVSSLSVAANYERNFKEKLITSCIFPQDKDGRPIYNPSGKYLIRLRFNGVERKIVVDDLLPVVGDSALACTYSTNKNELWASLIEKAYMKLAGGYTFPGSNSGIDLYALTGWTPEHLFINDASFDHEKQWKALYNGHDKGNILVTIATGTYTEEHDTMGLVPAHAYAVLKIKEVLGHRLLQVKNPWSHKRWKGPFSHMDHVRWTDDLKHALNYDQLGARQIDDGLFWIDFESVCRYFECIHINWNPKLYAYKQSTHFTWSLGQGPYRDRYNLALNPQYCLKVNNSTTEPVEVLILLTKHVTRLEDNTDFIAAHVFGNGKKKRIYYPSNTVHKGVYMNSPHNLVRLMINPGPHAYGIVISQHRQTQALSFSLKVQSLLPFSMTTISDPPGTLEQQVTGNWEDENAGGSISHWTHMNNPNYRVSIPEATSMVVMLEGPNDVPINIKILRGGQRAAHITSSSDIVVSSGDYRHGFCYLELANINAGEYTLIPSTFSPGQKGLYVLTFKTKCPLTITPIPLEGHGMIKRVFKSQWIPDVNAGGNSQSPNYHKNPKLILRATKPMMFKTRLIVPNGKPPLPWINAAVFVHDRQAEHGLGAEIANSGPYAQLAQGVSMHFAVPASQHECIVLFATWEPQASPFEWWVYTDSDEYEIVEVR